MATQHNLPKVLTTREVAILTGKTEQMVYLWRKGTASRDPLPATIDKFGASQRVTITTSKFLAWAKKYGIEVVPKRLEALHATAN